MSRDLFQALLDGCEPPLLRTHSAEDVILEVKQKPATAAAADSAALTEGEESDVDQPKAASAAAEEGPLSSAEAKKALASGQECMRVSAFVSQARLEELKWQATEVS